VQEAYGSILAQRRRNPVPPRSDPPPTSPDIEEKLAAMERDLLAKARAARQRAQRAARDAAATATGSKNKRPSDEDLGYVKTDDSFGKILADGLDDIADWLRRHSDSDSGN
jgi:hypothetical protein